MESANDDFTEIVCPVVSLIINYVCLSFSFSFSWSTYFSQSYLDQVRKQLRCTNYNNLAFSANTSYHIPTYHTHVWWVYNQPSSIMHSNYWKYCIQRNPIKNIDFAFLTNWGGNRFWEQTLFVFKEPREDRMKVFISTFDESSVSSRLYKLWIQSEEKWIPSLLN